MVKRRVNSPWGNVYKEGLPSTAVDDQTDVDQEVRPTILTGSIDVRSGRWEGVTLSDEQFRIDAIAEGIPNGGTVLCPQSEPARIDMTGFNDLFIAFNVATSGNYAITAVMGPDTNTFANLTPVNPAANLKGAPAYYPQSATITDNLFNDTAESLTQNVWNIFIIQGRLKGQKNMQFKITNNTSALSNIQFAYLRVV